MLQRYFYLLYWWRKHIDGLDYYRYDGRGHLYDLRPYDAEFVDSHYILSDKEKALEKACDEERYLELHTDVLTKQMYEGMIYPLVVLKYSATIDVCFKILDVHMLVNILCYM